MSLIIADQEIPDRIHARPMRFLKPDLHGKSPISFDDLSDDLTANRLDRIEHIEGVQVMSCDRIASNTNPEVRKAGYTFRP